MIQNPPTVMKRKAGLAPMSFWTLTHTLRHAPRWLFVLDGIGAIVTAAGVGLVLL